MEGRGLLVVGELVDGQLSHTSKELLAAGRRLAHDLGQELALGLLGTELQGPAREAFTFGAEKVYAVSSPLLDTFQVDLHMAALERLCRDVSPSIVLLARTAMGRDLAPRLAFRLGVGLAQDCLQVRIDPDGKRLLADRPVYGGNAMATVTFTQDPQIACIRPKAYDPLEPDESRQGKVEPLDVGLDPNMAKVWVTDLVKEESEVAKLEDARIIVAGGRGLGGPDPFKDLEELANVIGAVVGASRAAVDSGWVPTHFQIGLTGKSIAPDLYITIGISGASQHMAGCSGARVIVAINSDAQANIFKEARYGVVGDWKKVLPTFIETLRELVKS